MGPVCTVRHLELIIAYQVNSDLKLFYGYVFCICALTCHVHVLIPSSSFESCKVLEIYYFKLAIFVKRCVV